MKIQYSLLLKAILQDLETISFHTSFKKKTTSQHLLRHHCNTGGTFTLGEQKEKTYFLKFIPKLANNYLREITYFHILTSGLWIPVAWRSHPLNLAELWQRYEPVTCRCYFKPLTVYLIFLHVFQITQRMLYFNF